MRDLLRELILDFQRRPPDTGVPRRLTVEPVRGKAVVCVGARRSGKTTWVAQIAAARADAERSNLLYVNFFDERLCDLWSDGRRLGDVVEAYYSLYPAKRGAEMVHCFFDEIQVVPHWEPFVDRLLRTERCQVYLTGSSAQMLAAEVATQMRGRSLMVELFPFSFAEYLSAQGLAEGPLTSVRRAAVESAFHGYWETGGFPEVRTVQPATRVAIHQDYLHAVCLRDVVERHGVHHPRAVRDLALRLVNNVAGLHTVNKLTAYLQSLGHKAPKSAVAEYLDWFEDAYFFFAVRLFDASQSRQNANPRKVYAVDHALARSCGTGVLVNSGHLLENLVFATLRRAVRQVHYYRTRTGKEVDFVWRDGADRVQLVQVCETLAADAVRQREFGALAEAMDETGATGATVVTRGEAENTEVGGRPVAVTPFWRWALARE
jgi:predicted AAA+ superfamily ATPase